MRVAVLINLAGLLAAGSAVAQQADCGGFKWSVAREQTAFAGAGLPGIVNGAALPGPGQAAVLSLVKQDAVTFPVAPSRKPRHDTPYAGAFPMTPATAGTYQVTLSDDAWIEVAQGGKLLKQVGFSGSNTCPTIHKSVRFDLAAGPATLEISDAGKDSLKVEVVPKE